MTDRIDDLGRDAATAVRDATGDREPDGGLDAVVRRGRRRRVATPVAATLATLAVIALAVPGVSWLLGGTDPVGFEVADAPAAPAPDAGDADDAGDGATATEDGQADTGSAQPPSDDAEAGDLDPDAATDAATDTDADGDGDGVLGPSVVSPSTSFAFDEVATDGFPDGGRDLVLLTDVRVGAQDGFDRFVLEFDGQEMSPYRVAFIEPPVRADGSGEVVAVPGGAFLEVVLTAAAGVEFDLEATDGYRLTYEGPDRVRGATTVITEAVRTGDFEATLTWTIGLRESAPFAVTVLESPLRLVVDVAIP